MAIGKKKDDDSQTYNGCWEYSSKRAGINVVYTRTNDIYETPFKKATDANNSGADYFVSIHRNSSEKKQSI